LTLCAVDDTGESNVVLEGTEGGYELGTTGACVWYEGCGAAEDGRVGVDASVATGTGWLFGAG